jgi:hypothetical protein
MLASVLTEPTEVVSLAVGYIGLRAAYAGYQALLSGRSRQEIAEESAVAAAASVPTAVRIALVAVVYLLFN